MKLNVTILEDEATHAAQKSGVNKIIFLYPYVTILIIKIF